MSHATHVKNHIMVLARKIPFEWLKIQYYCVIRATKKVRRDMVNNICVNNTFIFLPLNFFIVYFTGIT